MEKQNNCQATSPVVAWIPGRPYATYLERAALHADRQRHLLLRNRV